MHCWVNRSFVRPIWWDTISSRGMVAWANGNNQWEYVASLAGQGLLVRSRHVALLFTVFVLVACPFQNMIHFSYYVFTLYTTRSDIRISTSPHAPVRMDLHLASLYIRLSLYACHATFHCPPPPLQCLGRLAVQLCSSAPDAPCCVISVTGMGIKLG